MILFSFFIELYWSGASWIRTGNGNGSGSGLLWSSFSSVGWPLFTRVSMHPKQE